jgi:hypothetical protein
MRPLRQGSPGRPSSYSRTVQSEAIFIDTSVFGYLAEGRLVGAGQAKNSSPAFDARSPSSRGAPRGVHRHVLASVELRPDETARRLRVERCSDQAEIRISASTPPQIAVEHTLLWSMSDTAHAGLSTLGSPQTACLFLGKMGSRRARAARPGAQRLSSARSRFPLGRHDQPPAAARRSGRRLSAQFDTAGVQIPGERS